MKGLSYNSSVFLSAATPENSEPFSGEGNKENKQQEEGNEEYETGNDAGNDGGGKGPDPYMLAAAMAFAGLGKSPFFTTSESNTISESNFPNDSGLLYISMSKLRSLIKRPASEKNIRVLTDKDSPVKEFFLSNLTFQDSEVAFFELDEDMFYAGGTSLFVKRIAEITRKHGRVKWLENYPEEKTKNANENGLRLFRLNKSHNIYYREDSESFQIALDDLQLQGAMSMEDRFQMFQLYGIWKKSSWNLPVTLVGKHLGGEDLFTNTEVVPLSYFASSRSLEHSKETYFEMEEGVFYQAKTPAFMAKFLQLEKTNPNVKWLGFRLPIDGSAFLGRMTYFLEGSKSIQAVSSDPISKVFLLPALNLKELKRSDLWKAFHSNTLNKTYEKLLSLNLAKKDALVTVFTKAKSSTETKMRLSDIYQASAKQLFDANLYELEPGVFYEEYTSAYTLKLRELAGMKNAKNLEFYATQTPHSSSDINVYYLKDSEAYEIMVVESDNLSNAMSVSLQELRQKALSEEKTPGSMKGQLEIHDSFDDPMDDLFHDEIEP